MIPGQPINFDFEIIEQTSNTFYLDIEKKRLVGYADQREAMRQAIYLSLNTERGRYIIVGRNYGVELLELYGKPVTFVLPEIKRRFTEALTHDTRITRLEGFEFAAERNEVLVTFTAVTIFGDIPIEKVVLIQ